MNLLIFILLAFYSIIIKSYNLPSCNNCKHFIPNNDINSISIGKCKLFLIIDNPPTIKDYHNIELVRNISNNINNEFITNYNICGKQGIFFKPKI